MAEFRARARVRRQPHTPVRPEYAPPPTSPSFFDAAGGVGGVPLRRPSCVRARTTPTGPAEPAPFRAARDGYPDGPRRLVLLGPPGTGKTRTALEGFLRPVLTPSTAEYALLCSFTRAAAGEIRRRLAADLGGDADRYRRTASTVHAEALRLVLRAQGEVRFVGAGRPVTRADDVERVVPEDALGGPEWLHEQIRDARRRAALRVWDLARNRLEQPDLTRAYHDAQPLDYGLDELRAEIAAYEELKREQREIDFVDLLRLALKIEPPLRELVLLDEAQDSSPLQWRLIERWGDAARWFVVVGDPDQSLHRWCGAAPERLLELSGIFEVRRLAQSHRVPRAHHALAVPLIRRNRHRIDAPYVPAPRDGDVREVDLVEAVAVLGEAASTATPTLVLGRSRRVLRRYAQELASKSTPYANERGYGPLGDADRRRVVRTVVALGEARPVEAADTLLLLRALPARDYFPPRKKAHVLEQVDERDPGDMVRRPWLESLGVRLDRLLVGRLVDRLVRLRLATTAPLRSRLAEDLARLVEVHGEGVLEQEPAVRLTTFHGAKGREAELVVVDLEAPRRVVKSLFDPAEVEAERQALYVSLSRSRDRLLLVRHARRDLGRELGLRRVS